MIDFAATHLPRVRETDKGKEFRDIYSCTKAVRVENFTEPSVLGGFHDDTDRIRN